MLTPLEKYFEDYSELGPRGRGDKSMAIIISLSPQCGGYIRALKNEKVLLPLFLVCLGEQWLQITGSLIRSSIRLIRFFYF